VLWKIRTFNVDEIDYKYERLTTAFKNLYNFVLYS